MTASPILISSVPVASQSSRALAFSFTQKIAIATCLITGKCAHLDAERGVPPRQRPQIGWDFLSGQIFTGWVYPLLLAQASSPHPTRRR
jgi:hypothetical protein